MERRLQLVVAAPAGPLLVLVVVLLLFGRRHASRRGPVAPRSSGRSAPGESPASGEPLTSAEAPAVRLDKESVAGPPPWATEARAWLGEAREAARARHRRSWPLRVAALTTLVATLTVLGVTDALVGIWLPVYFWVIGGIALVTLLVGGVLRRIPWSLVPLLVVGALGTVAFGGTHASLHDGVGQQVWTPATSADVRATTGLPLARACSTCDGSRRRRPTTSMSRSVQGRSGCCCRRR